MSNRWTITDMLADTKSLLTCCLVAMLLTAAPVAADTPENLMEQAQTAFDRSDIVKAMSLYRMAAEAGHAPAQSRLAYLLDNAEDNEAAVAWYLKAAEAGDAEGMAGLAQMYAAGEGTEQNLQEAARWFTLAAQQGHTPAIRVLALAYESGGLGFDVNYAQAISWLNAGVDANDVWSTQRLARALRQGELGLRIDREQAGLLEMRLPGKQTGNRSVK